MKVLKYYFALLFILLLAACGNTNSASNGEKPTAVEMWEEPAHRLALDKGKIKVIDLKLKSGDTSQYHTHRYPTVYLVVNDAIVGTQLWPEDWAYKEAENLQATGTTVDRSDYNEEPILHRIHNKDDEDFHLIGIINLGDGAAGDFDGGFLMENDWFKEHKYELKPDQKSGEMTFDHPALVVQFESGATELMEGGNPSANKTEAGDFFWVEPGTAFSILNNGSSVRDYTVVEIK